MAFKAFVPGATLTAAEVNTYLAKQSVIVCTSTTRPSSPPEGMTIYETDTDKLLTYTTATTGWQPPWNMPWGVMGQAVVSAEQTVASGGVDLTGASVTYTAVAGRRVRISAKALMSTGTSVAAGRFVCTKMGAATTPWALIMTRWLQRRTAAWERRLTPLRRAPVHTS